MISFYPDKYPHTKTGGVYLTYKQIEDLTESIIFDYRAELLSFPMAIEYDDFLKGYLGVDLDYQHIYSTKNEGDILGCAIFTNQKIAVFDKENLCKSYRAYNPYTVVLDLSLVEGDRIIQENITGLHEGGHVWMHAPLLAPNQKQITIQGMNPNSYYCRKDGMELVESIRPSTEEIWREWQATTFAVTIAMPKRSLKLSVPELFKKYGIGEDQLVIDADTGARNLSYNIIPENLSKIYNMSKEAIRYRLEKTGYYTTKIKYEEEHSQMTLFDFI